MNRSWEGAKEAAKQKIIEYIKDKGPRDKLPSENEMSGQFGVSRTTIRAALDDLTAEGVIVQYHGRGTFVNPISHKLKARLFPAQSIDQSTASCGYTPKSKYLGDSEEVADAFIADALQMPFGGPIVVSKTLLYADDNFCGLCVDHINSAMLQTEDISRLRSQNSVIFQLLFEKTARTVAWDFAQLDVTDTLRMPALAEYAGLPPGMVKPYLVMHTTEYDSEYRPLFHATFYLDTDYLKYGIISRKKVDLGTVTAETYRE